MFSRAKMRFYPLIAILVIGFSLLIFSPFSSGLGSILSDSSIADKSIQNIKPSKWSLVWSDEFEGNELDRSKWRPETSCWGGGNNEKQCYTDRSENIKIEDGFLKLIARPETFTGLAMPQEFEDRGGEVTQPYTSGKIRTKGLASWTYGRFEARLKLPQGQATWPAFWMMSEDNSYGAWPLSGEIDIVESVNLNAVCNDCFDSKTENRSISALHFGPSWPNNQFKSKKTSLVHEYNKFNRFAVEWSQERIDWYINDDLVYSVTAKDWFTSTVTKKENPYAPFDKPFYLMLNLAVGGNLSVTQNEKAFRPESFPTALEVDWVRVYQRKTGLGNVLPASY